MQSDKELIEAVNKGSPDAFEALYLRYRDWVYHLAWRFTGNHEDALDALQETFTYLLKKFPHFKLTCSMTTFLYPVVKHISLTIRRKAARQILGEEKLSELPASLTEEKKRSRTELATVLTILTHHQREVLLMRFVDEMNLEEIATALNIPLSTAKSRLYRALEILRNDHRTRDYFLE